MASVMQEGANSITLAGFPIASQLGRERVVELAKETQRRTGIAADSHPEFWRALLDELQVTSQEHEFLPGVSRLVADTGLAGRGRSTTRVWLRTHYRR